MLLCDVDLMSGMWGHGGQAPVHLILSSTLSLKTKNEVTMRVDSWSELFNKNTESDTKYAAPNITRITDAAQSMINLFKHGAAATHPRDHQR